MTENERQHLIEGYKALTQYGCQLSADHISTDRIMIPLSLAPALLVLSPPNGEIVSRWAETLILLGGVVFIWFWHHRNLRNEKRLHAIWDILRLIEAQLGFEAYLTLQRFMDTMVYDNGRWRKLTPNDQKQPKSDFTLKKYFAGFAFAFYLTVGSYVWWENIASWLRC